MTLSFHDQLKLVSPEYPQLQLLGYYEISEGVLKAGRLKTVKFIKGRK